MGSVTERDTNLDFVRGLALLIIFSDHVAGNPLTQYLPLSLCLWDMTDVFVFTSGYVSCVAYRATLERDGFVAAQRKTLRRLLQFYFAYLCSIATLKIVDLLLTFFTGGIDSASTWLSHVRFSQADFWTHVCFRGEPQTLAPLGLFAVLALLTPSILSLRRSNPLLLFSASIGAYTYIQSGLVFETLPPQDPMANDLNPLAWQLTFVMGMEAAWSKNRIRAIPTLVRLAMTVIAVGLLEVPLVLEIASANLPRYLAGRGNDGLLRLLSVSSLMCIAFWMPSPSHQTWHTWPIRWVARCGRHGLVCYCTGVVAAAMLNRFISRNGANLDWMGYAMLNLGGWFVCYLASLITEKMRRSTQATP